MSRPVKRRYTEIASNDYTVCVESADKPQGVCRGIIHVRLLGDGKVGGEDELAVAEFPDNFERGHKNFFQVDEPKIRNIEGIEVRGDSMVGTNGWNIDKLTVTNNKTGTETIFPVFKNIKRGRTYKFMKDDLSLPQFSSRRKDRQSDLEEAREEYQLTDNQFPGCPPLVEKLPPCEKFSFGYKLFIGGKLATLTVAARVEEKFTGDFNKLDDLKRVYGAFFPEPGNLERWHSDVIFGMQRLMSINPDVIRLCTEIPCKLDVTDEMLKPFLEDDMTLQQALQRRRIFIIDYEIFDGLPENERYCIVAPIALFYQRHDGKLIPIAIQLFQTPGPQNPVFLPSDPKNTWILAKMWFNVADSNYHQSVSHLGFTHMKMEGVVACTHRQIHNDHPLYKLLMPHFLYLLAINNDGIPLLIGKNGKDGFVAELLNVGNAGLEELIRRRNKTWRMDVDGTLPNDLRARGVDGPDLLPDYYYRDDGIEIYKAIHSYVQKYLDLYYASDRDVQKDDELQNWRTELVGPVDENGCGMLGVYGDKDKFTTIEQVCLTLTSIIFTCSAQHAAVNFRQYEDYAYPPNFPLCLRRSPPTTKDSVHEDDLLQYLPQTRTTYDTLIITSVLSSYRTHELGNFEVNYITDYKALKVVDEFKAELARISKRNKDLNENERIETYRCLDPKRVPNSISI